MQQALNKPSAAPKRLQEVPMQTQDPEERINNFDEVAQGYTEEQALTEANRCLTCPNPQCVKGCPVGVDIPAFIKHIKEKDYQAAIQKIKERNSLPAICGRVCPQEEQCQKQCVLGKKGEAVSIGRLERFVADKELENRVSAPTVPPCNGRKIAIVGGGPAGLTVAADLAKLGYRVVLYEALHVAGGVLVYGIPEFRLPKKIVQAEVNYIKQLGVEVRTDALIGRLFTVDELFKKGFDAVFIGTGAGLPRFLGVPGENLGGVYSANEFLIRVNLMKSYRFPDFKTPMGVGKKVVVIGGGNVALDSARCALRSGADSVTVVYRRSREAMPARLEEVEHALEESVDFKFLSSPTKFLGDENGRVKGMEYVTMKLGEPDKSGRRSVVPVEGSEKVMDVDTVIVAIGRTPNPIIQSTTDGLETNRKGILITNPATGKTTLNAVYAGGDIATGEATVISAMGSGKKAAQSIHEYLKNGCHTSGTFNLDKIFNPKSVAIIGASDEKGSVGQSIVANFQSGYTGKVYYVNMRKPELFGVKTYPSISDVPKAVDLAMIATPAKTVPTILEQCGKSGVKGVIIVSAGFKETGKEGKILEEQILKVARKYGVRVVGPNCIGVIHPQTKLNATFINKMPLQGTIAFISQSGALGSAILGRAIDKHIGFSHFVSVGSMTDVDFGDLIEYFDSDPQTNSILMYVEGITEARKFMSAARRFAKTKPLVVLKAGKYGETAKAVASHTGSLSGENNTYDAAFQRAGIVRVNNIDDLFNIAEMLSTQPLPKGPSLAVITNAGGPGVMATDEIIAQGGKIAPLSPSTIEDLDAVLPAFWSRGNPIDVLGDAKASRYQAALEACLNDDEVDGVLIIFTQQLLLQSMEVARAVVDAVKYASYKKPVFTSFMGDHILHEAINLLNANSIPTYPTPEQAIKAYLNLYRCQRNFEQIRQAQETPFFPATAKMPITDILKKVAQEDRDLLTEYEAKKVLKYYSFPVIETKMARTAEEAVDIARHIGYPVALKVLSPQIMHKTDAGGVVLDICSEQALRSAFEGIINKAKAYDPDAEIQGVTVQRMVKTKGCELIIGAKTDPLFGPVILFGMGGVGVELFKDYALALPPLNTTLVRRMLKETKVYTLLNGYRNVPRANLALLEENLLLFSQLLIDFPQIKEIDINPLLINQKELVILDARIVIDKNFITKQFKPYQHMAISPYSKEYAKEFLPNTIDATIQPQST
ncbi:MAG: NADPH-dependent glutamate synthase [Candidatus Bathyarchaeota archaeon]|nr:NADPH-dependent glutamate synthase [Candidatus Bathyarchaeota archaeon]